MLLRKLVVEVLLKAHCPTLTLESFNSTHPVTGISYSTMKYGSSEQIGRLPLSTPKIATSCFIRIFFMVRWTSRCLATSFCERYIDQVDYSENRQVAFSLYCALLQFKQSKNHWCEYMF